MSSPQTTESIAADFERARVLFAAGRFSEAAVVCRAILALEPKCAKALHMLARILTDEGKIPEALLLIEQAGQLEPNHSAIRAAYGRLLLDAGRVEDAIGALQAAVSLDAGNIEAYHFLAIAFLHIGRLEKAESTLRAALTRQPEMPELLDDLGTVLARRGDHTGAQACFEEALRHAPDDLGALGQLALWHEQNNRVGEASRLVLRGLEYRPQDPFLRFILGRCQRRRSEYAQASATLGTLLDSHAPALEKDVEYELALCADAMNEPDAAYAHALGANTLAARIYPRAVQQGQEFVAMAERLHERFTRAWVASWSDLSVDSGNVSPVFLIGFPRSGTTLLDTMLGAHPEVRVLEERPGLEAAIAALAQASRRYPEGLQNLSTNDRRILRQSYFSAAGVDGHESAQMVLDKSPLYSMHVGLIRRLFPQARILFMLRHPCDVVLSCFMTNFEINSSTVNFLELGNTVKLYCAVMSLWHRYREVLQPQCYQVRYEDLVADGEQALRGATQFLGLDWVPGLLDHAKHAFDRGRIQSASYAQVTRPLYANACGRWRRYRKYLEPYLSQLKPWCERFGYTA